MTLTLALLLAVLAPVPDSLLTEDRQEVLRASVLDYIRPIDPDWESTTMRSEWADLNGDGLNDAVVYLSGRMWCGSGGCTALILEAMPEEDMEEMGAFRPAAEISMMYGPLTVRPNPKSEWSDLIVQAADGTSVALQFDGETYPLSPSDGIPVTDSEKGVTLFAELP